MDTDIILEAELDLATLSAASAKHHRQNVDPNDIEDEGEDEATMLVNVADMRALTGGRPKGVSLYKEEYNLEAYKLALLGATDEDLGKYFGVSSRTIRNWMNSHPTFKKRYLAGKVSADADVVMSAYKRANGYESYEVRTHVIDGEVVQTTVPKHIPGDPKMIDKWLSSRQRQMWSTKQNNIEIDTTDDEVKIKISYE